MSLDVSLVIPVYNESQSIGHLINTIKAQILQPAEVILVDGGSTDDTVKKALELTGSDPKFIIIEAGRAMPGKGRNIGTTNARYHWIAFTDAGIRLDPAWMKNLVATALKNPEAEVIYGNYSPQLDSLFDECSMYAYVPALRPGKIRSRCVPSTLLRKEVWERVGKFPDWRAAEDLEFMDRIEAQKINTEVSPAAIVYWKLQPNLKATFRKFDLYSLHNVLAGRQATWHYGVLRQYVFMLAVILLVEIVHNWIWLLIIPAWLLLRVIKRIIAHRYQMGIGRAFHPAVITLVTVITLTIDAATFTGWIRSFFRRRLVR